MYDSEFWRILAVDFQAMANERDTIRAVWTYLPKVGKDQWQLDGANSPATQQRYETLAVRAGKKIGPTSSDPLAVWLGFLKTERPIKAGSTSLGDESPCVYGAIDRLCSVSAEVCKILEGRTVRAVPLETSSWPTDDSISELRSLGLTLDIDENTARKIMGELLVTDGRWRQGAYPAPNPEGHSRGHFHAAYHAIAERVVCAETSNEILEEMIPAVVQAFKTKQQWLPKIALDVLTQWLQGPISEWKGKRLLMGATEPGTAHRAEDITALSREQRLQAFIKAHDVSIARVERSADVDGKNMDQWRRNDMKDTSVMAERIEDVLAGRRALKA
ncbi:MAG: hypothetical protein ACLPWF_23440 [Bryobacteraceae bacterium]